MTNPTLAHKAKPLDHSKSVARAKAAGAVSFSDFAAFKLKELYDNPDGFIGRKHPDLSSHSSKIRTDCITYVIACLQAGFEGIGDTVARGKVNSSAFAGMGTKIQKYLVDARNWTGVYYAQDRDNLPPYRDNASRKCNYWGVNAEYILANYQKPNAHLPPSFGTAEEVRGNLDLNALSRIPFAFGISSRGTHTWLLSLGKVYEVHWRAMGQSGVYGSMGLYESQSFRKFTSGKWAHGSIVVPKGQSPSVSALSKMSCAS